LVHPIRHRGPEVQKHLAILRARDVLVRTRTKLTNHVRGTVKSVGGRIQKCSTESFARTASVQIPADLREVMRPLLEVIQELNERIRAFDRRSRRRSQHTTRRRGDSNRSKESVR